jgi:hypothetical protein
MFVFFCLFSEDNIQIITEISENATKEYSIERILQNIIQIWNYLKFETTLHKPNVFKIKYLLKKEYRIQERTQGDTLGART